MCWRRRKAVGRHRQGSDAPQRTVATSKLTAARRLMLTTLAAAPLAASLASANAADAATATDAAGAASAATAAVTRSHQDRAATAHPHPRSGHPSDAAKPLASKDLWATIDICKTAGTAAIGVRGSMPPDGHSHHLMFMRFKLQYHDDSTGKWVDLRSSTVASGYVKVGPANATRQGGRSFQLAPSATEGEFELRGLVYFQWRNRSKVVLSAVRPTTSGHRSAVGAAPRGFSAATCVVK